MAELFPMLCLALGAARVEPGAVAELVPVLWVLPAWAFQKDETHSSACAWPCFLLLFAGLWAELVLPGAVWELITTGSVP